MENDRLFIIVPCYNESEVITFAYQKLKKKLNQLIECKKINDKSKILFVDDGSNDDTWKWITHICHADLSVSGLRLANNVGHQNALIAGLYQSCDYCDVTITIDADLQQDINAIDRFIEKYDQGNDIVYGIRNSRDTDNFFKKSTANIFYFLMNLLGVRMFKNHADYRLLSKRAIQALKQFKEVNLFLRGTIPLIGFQYDVVYFDVFDRAAGTSKYTLKKMMTLAINGITSLSVKPIRLIILSGLFVFFISIFILIYFVTSYFLGITVQGWTSTIISVWAIGGLQLLSIGIIGEYIAKTYLETKERPRYIVWEYLNK